MAERKVFNKYFPPDFDPSKVRKGKRVRTEDKQMKVRMMLPMSVRCSTCGNFMAKGTKFNTRMEDVKGEDYLGIKIFRFYYKCTNCSAEFCMKTDPKSTDYIVEAGATRNYEPWRDKAKTEGEIKAKREEEEKGNAMKALENKTLDSKREMDILTALDEMKSLKARHEHINTETALAALKNAALSEQPADLDVEDEEAVRQMLLQRAGFVKRLSSSSSSEEDYIEQEADGGELDGEGIAVKANIKKKARKFGGGPSSIAATLWEQEGEEEGDHLEIEKKEKEEGRKIHGLPHREENIASHSTIQQHHSQMPGSTRMTDDQLHARKNTSTVTKESKNKKGPAHGAWEAPLVPSFSKRSAVVVIKPKVSGLEKEKKETAAAAEKIEGKKGEESKGGTEEENPLQGLLGYSDSD